MINPIYSNPNGSVCEELSGAFQRRMPHNCTETGAEVIAKVYPTVVLPKFLTVEGHQELKAALDTAVKYEEKRADLYRFYQSGDIKEGGPRRIDCIKRLHHALLPWISFVERIIGRPLSRSHIDVSSQKYSVHEYLLGHDDRLESRRVAFVLYFVDESDLKGGALEFYPTDWKHRPCPIETTDTASYQAWAPKNNHLAFFEVTRDSHHQVAEVLRGTRVSIAGWFHDPRPEEVAALDYEIDLFLKVFNGLANNVQTLLESDNVFTEEFHLSLSCYISYRMSEMRRIVTKTEAFHYFLEVEEAEWMRKLTAVLARNLSWSTRPVLKIYRKGDYRQCPPDQIQDLACLLFSIRPKSLEASVAAEIKDNRCMSSPIALHRSDLLKLPNTMDDYIAFIEVAYEK